MRDIDKSVTNLQSLLNDLRCPICKTDLKDKPIPQEYIDKGYYRKGDTIGHKYYSRLVAVYNIFTDKTEQYRCPDCNTVFDRFSGIVIEY